MAKAGAGVTNATPKVTGMRVVPVAGEDSMLLNLSGAHAPMFTRNIVILTDSSGRTGLGEVPGGEAIARTLEDARPLIEGREIGAYRSLLRAVGEAFASRDAGGRGAQTFDLRVTIHAVAALECALLDLMGQFLGVPMAELLGDGQVRDRVEMLGYLFYVGDRQQDAARAIAPPRPATTGCGCATSRRSTPAAIVRLAEAAEARYGFRDFKLKGGVLAGDAGGRGDRGAGRAVPRGAADHRSERRVVARGGDAASARTLKPILAYAEDPCGAEAGFSGREVLAEFRRAHRASRSRPT